MVKSGKKMSVSGNLGDKRQAEAKRVGGFKAADTKNKIKGK